MEKTRAADSEAPPENPISNLLWKKHLPATTETVPEGGRITFAVNFSLAATFVKLTQTCERHTSGLGVFV